MRAWYLTVVLLLIVAGCDTAGPVDPDPDPELVRMENVPADPADVTDQRPEEAGRFTFVNLADAAIVAGSDSATTKWDIAFRGTTILVNGGASGPGEGSAQVLTGVFEEIEEAPGSGYATDSSAGPAIVDGSGNGWYSYNPVDRVISPTPGRVIVLTTADGKYAKIKILSYYKDAPDVPTAESTPRYYTFEVLHQPDGSRMFK